MTDATAIDPLVFTLDNSFNPFQLSIYTEDGAKAGLYGFTIKVTNFLFYPDNTGVYSKNFSVLIEDDISCFSGNILITPSIVLADETYELASPAFTTLNF